MSRTIVARSVKDILGMVANGSKLTVVSTTKNWVNATGKQSKTTGNLYLDGQEVALEFENVRCPGGFRLATFDNDKKCVSLTLSWTDEQAAELLELEKLIVKEGLFVTYQSVLSKFQPESFMDFKWSGGVLPPAQAKDPKTNELIEGKFYPRASFVDCPFETRDKTPVPAFALLNSDNSPVAQWTKLVGQKMMAQKVHVTYEISVYPNLEKNFKVKLTCRYLQAAAGGVVTTISASVLPQVEVQSKPAITEPDSKRRKVEPSVPVAPVAAPVKPTEAIKAK
jgi:hypothetical protein